MAYRPNTSPVIVGNRQVFPEKMAPWGPSRSHFQAALGVNERGIVAQLAYQVNPMQALLQWHRERSKNCVRCPSGCASQRLLTGIGTRGKAKQDFIHSSS